MSVLMGAQATTNEREARGYRWLWSGMLGVALSVVPLQGSRAVTTQEQPRHPSSFLSAGTINPPPVLSPGVNVMLYDGSLQEQPAQLLPTFRTGTPSTNVPATTTFVIVTREQPGHPSSFLGNRASPSVGSAETRATIIRQEPPSHSGPLFRAGVQGPNVASGVGSVVVPPQALQQTPSFTWFGQFSTVSTVPVIMTVIQDGSLQEQPPRPPSILASFVAPVAGAPERRSLKVIAERPWHPSPNLWAGVQGPNVGLSFAAPLVTKQELPRGSFVVTSAGVPSVQAASAALLTAVLQDGSLQEQPAYSQSVLRFGAPKVGAGGFETRVALVRQETPFHPGSWFDRGVQGPDVVSSSGGTSFVKGTQSDALQRDLRGQAWLWPTQAYVAPVSVAPERRAVITTQEAPSHPAPYVWRAQVFTAAVPSIPVVTTIIQDGYLQEQPPRQPSVMTSFVTLPPILVPAGQRGAATRQEAPFHPSSYLFAGTPPVPVVLPAVSRVVVTRQEQPDHPLPFARMGAAFVASVFISPERRAVATTQEQPRHPAPIVFAGVPPIPALVPPGRRWVVVGQEQPAHPGPQLWTGTPPVTVTVSPVRRALVVGQEQPWHSLSFTWSGNVFLMPTEPDAAQASSVGVYRAIAWSK